MNLRRTNVVRFAFLIFHSENCKDEFNWNKEGTGIPDKLQLKDVRSKRLNLRGGR